MKFQKNKKYFLESLLDSCLRAFLTLYGRAAYEMPPRGYNIFYMQLSLTTRLIVGYLRKILPGVIYATRLFVNKNLRSEYL